jgi:hypothetical protein
MEEYDSAHATNILFSIHPANKSRSRMRPAIATDRIHDIVLAQVSRLDAVEQSRFFGMISGHPWLKSPLGHFYEKLMHVRLTADPDAQPLSCLAAEDEPPVIIPVVSNVVSISGSTNLRHANKTCLPFYWRPVSQTFTTFDAIICTTAEIFLLQSTVSPDHDMKRQGLEFIRKHIPAKFWRERRRYIVFVSPDESRATRLCSAFYPELNDFEEVEVLPCVFPIGTSTFTALQLQEVQNVGLRLPLLEILSLIALSSTARLFQTKMKMKISRIKISRMKMKLGMMWEVLMPTPVTSDSKAGVTNTSHWVPICEHAALITLSIIVRARN